MGLNRNLFHSSSPGALVTNLSFLIALVALTACGQNPRAVWQKRPPISGDYTGYLVQSNEANAAQTQAKLENLMADSNGSGRIISAQHGLFEVEGVAPEKLREALPEAHIEKNVYLTNLIPTHAGSELHNDDILLETCLQNDEAPKAVINIESDKALQAGVLLRGSTIKVNLKGTAANPKYPGPIRTAWMLSAPKSSLLSDVQQHGDTFEFKPDALGGYTFGLVVQDSRNVCDVVKIKFVLTANDAFAGAKTPRTRTAEDLAKFAQLGMVDAPEAWKTSEGEGAVIAVIDSGVYYNHPDLSANILINEKETPANNIDDDSNGLVDDYVGWDFINNDSAPYDDDGHGTHVAALAASAVTGIAPKAKILPIKALNGLGGGDIGSIAGAIMYAVDRGATVINCSFGSVSKVFLPLQKAIQYAQSKGVIIVAAAGNGDIFERGFSVDRKPYYPVSFDLDNILGVAALDENGDVTTYSNFGVKHIAVAAPGGTQENKLWSAAADNPKKDLYADMVGTSMATPIVSGVIALAQSAAPKLKYTELLKLAEKAGTAKPAMASRVRSSRMINANELLKMVTSYPELDPIRVSSN